MSVRSVGIVGAGTMGSGIAQVFATAGFGVVITDVSTAAAEKGVTAIADRLERLVAKAKMSAEESAAAMRRIVVSSRYEDLGSIDLLIEAAPEDAEALKAGIFRRVDPIVRPDTILASNTSSVSITRLASSVSQPGRFIGMHFFNPVPVMRLVEVVRSLQTSDATHDAVEALITRIGKTPITVKSSPGFVVNRLLLPMLNEAFFALAEGDAAASDIDDAMKLGCNHPIGPLALADLIGLDVLLAVMQTMHNEFGEFEVPPGATPQGDGGCRVFGTQVRSRRVPILRTRSTSVFKSHIVASALIALTVAACDKPAPPASQARPVRAVTVERRAEGETVSLTGHIRAKDQASLAFRLDGRMIERPVNVGDVLTAGQVVAKLDPKFSRTRLRSAEGNLSSLEAQLSEARITFWRQQELLKDGWTSRAKFDEAEQKLQTIQAQVDCRSGTGAYRAGTAELHGLVRRCPGCVTANGAEPGEVVHAGQMIVEVARQGGRDAVFDVPEQLTRTGPRDPLVQIALTNDPTVRATGRVREVAPQADATTRTFQFKVGIIDPPQGMELGSTVTGSIKLSAPPAWRSRRVR